MFLNIQVFRADQNRFLIEFRISNNQLIALFHMQTSADHNPLYAELQIE